MHAQTADPPECHRQIRHTMERKNERNEGRKCLTSNTVAYSLGVTVWEAYDIYTLFLLQHLRQRDAKARW